MKLGRGCAHVVGLKGGTAGDCNAKLGGDGADVLLTQVRELTGELGVRTIWGVNARGLSVQLHG